MGYELPVEEREYLRGLARRQMEIAALPVMAERRKLWEDINDNVPGARPPFAIETWTFDRDFMPASIFRCTSEQGRRLEYGFLATIRRHELINDDVVCPGTLDMGWHVHTDTFGIDIKWEQVKDAEGHLLGSHTHYPITDLATQGFGMIKPTTFSLNRESTFEQKAFLEEAFGDIMPVVMRSGVYAHNYLTHHLLCLMSMETFFLSMYDCPDTLHGIMGLLRDNAKRLAQWAEAEGILELNNTHQCTCGTCYNFTKTFPKRTPERGKVRLSDMWAGMNSQETVGVAPELFHEFCYPYYNDLAELYGQVYWGCCEDTGPIWELSLSKLAHLKGVSISRWANQEYMAEALKGTGIIFSRKPDPNLLGILPGLDEAAWRKEIRDTLEITSRHGVPTQLVVRDVYSLQGDVGKARRATDIAREEINKIYG